MDIHHLTHTNTELSSIQVDELLQLALTYPFWHLPLTILCRNYRIQNHPNLDTASKMAALRIHKQSALYDYVYTPNLVNSNTKNLISQEATIDLTVQKNVETKNAVVENEVHETEILESIEKTTIDSKIEDFNLELEPIKADLSHTESSNFIESISEEELNNNPTDLLIHSEKLEDSEIINKTFIKTSELEVTKSTINENFIHNEERTLKEIEEILSHDKNITVIPDLNLDQKPEQYWLLNTLNQNYEISRFELPKKLEVHKGTDFYFWLTESNKLNTNSLEDKLHKVNLLDSFISNNPVISKIDDSKEIKVEINPQINTMPLEIATETLARIYTEQGNILAAKKIYEQLIVKYPLKSTYFATLIKSL